MLENKIEELLLEKFKEAEYQDCFIIEIAISNQNVEISLDADEGLEIGKCQRISRYIEHWLDTEGVLGEEYTIEVSSPGVSRPLLYPRQYPKHVGRFLDVTNTEGVLVEGELKAVDNQGVTLEFETIRKEGKKKIKELQQTIIPFDKINTAFVQIRF